MSTYFISTFAKDHIPIYAKNFLTSYNEHSKFPLILYAEDFSKDELPGEYTHMEFNKEIPAHKNFKDLISIADKDTPDIKAKRRLAKALRWSYKAFTILHALRTIDAKYIVWIDGDVTVKRNLPLNFIESLIEEKLCMAYLEKLQMKDSTTHHIESGLVVFNKTHKLISHIIHGYSIAYEKGNILNYSKPWDGILLAEILLPLQSYCNLLLSPFSNVKSFLHHAVGKNKFINQDINRYSGRKDLLS